MPNSPSAVVAITTLDQQGNALPLSVSNIPSNIDMPAALSLIGVTTNGNSGDLTNVSGRGIQIGVNITSEAGTTPTLTIIVQGKDPASGVYYTILTSLSFTFNKIMNTIKDNT